MALTVEEIIEARAPQFKDDSRIDKFIEIAELMTSNSAFGDRYNYAVALRVCHFFASESLRGGSEDAGTSGSAVGGRIESEKEGDLSRSYAVNESAVAGYGDLSNTQFGLELIDLINGSIFAPRTKQMGEQGSEGVNYDPF